MDDKLGLAVYLFWNTAKASACLGFFRAAWEADYSFNVLILFKLCATNPLQAKPVGIANLVKRKNTNPPIAI